MTVCVILAAGTAARMGRPKLLLTLGASTLLERAIDACADFSTVIVAARELLPVLEGRRTIVNDAPQRGMTHSLRLADAIVDPACALLVVPADMPNLTAETVNLVANAPPAEVAYPLVDGRPGHPVRFSAQARGLLCNLRDGDTLRELRDDPRVTRVIAGAVSAESQYDVDTAEDYATLCAGYTAPSLG